MRLGTLILTLALTGCASPFFKSTSGINVEIGVSVPSQEEANLSIAHYLSGDRVVVTKDATIRYKLNVAETNSYLGVIHTNVNKMQDIVVEPKEQ